MTTKHHEGFCHWDTKLTDYCAPKQGPGRDLVREFVDAARAEGLRVGFYYSLMDWHHPDGALCKTDEAARKRFVEYTHGLIRELMTNYGKIDVLWYDVDWPLNADQWESERMNQMVFELQPEIIVNNRNGLARRLLHARAADRRRRRGPRLGDLHDPQRQLGIQPRRRRLEDAQDHRRATWPPARGAAATTCSTSAPSPTGPSRRSRSPSLKPSASGSSTNGKAIYGTERGSFGWNTNANYTRRGNTLYIHQQLLARPHPGGRVAQLLPARSSHRHRRPQAQGPLRPHPQDRPTVAFTQDEFTLASHRPARSRPPTSPQL